MNYERTMKQAVISTERRNRVRIVEKQPDFYLILKQKQPE